MTKEEMIIQLKSEYPTLRTGDDENGYVELSAEEYEITMSDWADAELKKLENEQAEIEATAKRQAAEAKLAALGLNAEDLKALGL
jgi:hypothetical protein